MDVRRLEGNPIITPATHERLEDLINGPSLVRVPEWVEDPLGDYYLYFAAHDGETITLATADEFTGPWTLSAQSPLRLAQAGPGFDDHIASPDVHVDHDRERFRMYYHGCCSRYEDETGTTRGE